VSTDWDERDDEGWCRQQRASAIAYVADAPDSFGRVGDKPAWYVAPYIAIWAVDDPGQSGTVRWWVICGDLPTDYLSVEDAASPRQAAAAFAERWSNLAAHMQSGVIHPDSRIENRGDAPLLAPLLESRARLLAEFARDTTLWSE
jgi:Domain of unknown function (DUF4826)